MATSKRLHSKKLSYISVVIAIVLGLYFSSLYSYILFHSLIEITTIAVAFALFALTWNTRKYLANSYLRLLGIGYAFIALIDLLHTLAYKGMGVFSTYGSNLPTQLWIAARYLQAVTLLAAPLFVERKVNNRAIIGIYVMAVSALVALVYSGNFPACYIEGKGLTPFKIKSEYVISAFLLASLYLFYRKRKYFDNKVFFLIAASIACTVLSEISFTAYVSVYGFANLVGHFAKLAAFYLIYQAILVTGLQQPFDLIFRDLKQAEEALRKSQDTLEEKVKERTAELRVSEERYRSLIQKVQTAIVLHDSQGRILTSNPLAQRLLGLSEAQLLGKALIDPEWHFLKEDGSVMPVPEYPASRVLASRQPLRDYVAGISCPDRGDVTWALVNAEPEYDEAGDIAQVIVSFVDITARKRAEEALHRLNRELCAISNCNQTLLRAEDEQTLLNDVCHIICDEAGYRLAWVGYAEQDDARTVRAVAWGGSDGEYVANAKLSWADDTERGRGPGGTAIRSGEIVYIQDFTTDPRMAPWRESALQRGYRSVIGLPLKDENADVFGVLLIYSTEVNAFTPDELRLLEELAGDLAFGIIVLRTRAIRKQAEDVLRISEERYRMAQAMGHVGNWEYNLQTTEFWGSDEAKRIYGFDLEQPNFTTDEVENCIPEREQVHQALVDLIEADKPYNLEFEIHPKNSLKPRILSSVADLKRDEHGNPLLVTGVIQDITERMQAEEALRQSEELLCVTLTNILDPVFITDNDGKFTFICPNAPDALGYSVEEIQAMGNISKLVRNGLFNPEELEMRGEITNIERLMVDNFGRPRVFLVNVKRVSIGKGTRLYALHDITERQRSEERIRRQLAHLTALSAIDRIITANYDLGLSLSEILFEATMELGVDAADILIFNPTSQMLEFSAERGFRTKAVREARVRLGESYAGRAALERQLVQIPNLRDEPDNLLLTTLLADDDFVCYYGVPLIAKGQVKGVLEIFHRAALKPDVEWFDFLNILAGETAIAIENVTLFESLQRSNSELALAYDATIEGWSRALDLRDKETEGHSKRVTEMTVKLARAIGLSEADLVQVRWGALLHDIGKMGVPDGILLKPGFLTNEEWVVMKKHPTFAYELLAPIRYLRQALDIPHYHHEKWDGTGYPHGLKGVQIPLVARIFAVVDVWDALSSGRSYRPAWKKEEVREHIRALSGTHFDPQVVDLFMRILN